jgi:uncharacterized protein with HEPN domain
MPHDAKVLLEDVRLAAEDIEQFTAGKSLSDYLADRLLRAAVERLYIVIGEALARLERTDPGLAAGVTDLRRIIDFRNVLVHGYEVIDPATVWQTTEQHLPVLRAEAEGLLARLGGP